MVLSQAEYSALVKECERVSVSPTVLDVTKDYLWNITQIRKAEKGKVGVPTVIPTTPTPVKVHSPNEKIRPDVAAKELEKIYARREEEFKKYEEKWKRESRELLEKQERERKELANKWYKIIQDKKRELGLL